MSRSARSCPGPRPGHRHPTCVSNIKSSVAVLKKFLGCLKISPCIFLSNPGIVNTSFSFIKPMYVYMHALLFKKRLTCSCSSRPSFSPNSRGSGVLAIFIYEGLRKKDQIQTKRYGFTINLHPEIL